MIVFPSPTPTYHNNSYPSISPTRPELSAKGKNVIVTGGGTGIGAAIAHAFAEAGASRVAILGRREQPLLDTKTSIEKSYPGVEIFAAPTDVTKKSEVDAAFANFLGDEKLHVLISNATISGPFEGMRDVDPERFLDAVHQNIAGATYISQAVFRHGVADAVVVNVSSNAMHINFGPGLPAYAVSKQAMFRLWDSVGFSSPEMSVFHIQPGIVDTEMNRSVDGVKAFGQEDHSSLPANFCVWLASPESRFLKGKFLWANWDVDELKSRAKELETSEELKIGLVGWPFGRSDWTDSFGRMKYSESDEAVAAKP